MLVNTFHAALKDRIVAFQGVGVHDVANVFLTTMVDGAVRRELRADTVIHAAKPDLADELERPMFLLVSARRWSRCHG
ncbi:hypothetical protein X739_26520 [Mesorhizobium sp. LNHC220B00]|nr:hypothetical protein X739_26520 [Mesorhizobium sp. LNHC220B00]ESY94279.1 hypothetical protein X741_12355 [Mesorhizobium sp. LNHC229A00]